jgi:sigma-B regulation protein RsbU (phosphoserine phosphatase)
MPSSSPRRRPASYHRQLDLIAEMSHAFASSHDLRETLVRGLRQVADFIEAEAAGFFLVDEITGELVCHACVGPVDITGLRLAPGQGIVGRVVAQNVATLVADARADPHFGALVDLRTGFVTRSILCAPLSVQGHCLGAIELINGAFRAGDRQLLRAIGASVALAVVNARLAKAMVEQERLARELELAAEIQRAMLPAHLPGDFPVQGINHPAREVSGDFFDILQRADGRVAFAIGDVAGKGIDAALLMAKTCSLFRFLAKTQDRPAALLSAINAELCETAGSRGTFVTMVAGLFDPVSGAVLLANAGHEPPLLHWDGLFTSYPAGAPPLGIDPGLVTPAMPETRIALGGGCLYLFTDGLTEAFGNGHRLGSGGVQRMISAAAGLPADRRLAAIVDRLAPTRDDLTALLVEDRRGPPLLRLELDAAPEALSEIRRRVAEAVLKGGGTPGVAADVVLAVGEAVQNVICHGYGGPGPLALEIRRDGGGPLTVHLTDCAPRLDLASLPERCSAELQPGGLGLHFMRSVMDQVTFLPAPVGCGNLLTMTKALP